jgi:hypothetical protein
MNLFPTRPGLLHVDTTSFTSRLHETSKHLRSARSINPLEFVIYVHILVLLVTSGRRMNSLGSRTLQPELRMILVCLISISPKNISPHHRRPETPRSTRTSWERLRKEPWRFPSICTLLAGRLLRSC